MVDQRASVDEWMGIHSVFSTVHNDKEDAHGLKSHFCPAKIDVLLGGQQGNDKCK